MKMEGGVYEAYEGEGGHGSFEFPKGAAKSSQQQKAAVRVSKTAGGGASSKWEDAQKWLVSPSPESKPPKSKSNTSSSSSAARKISFPSKHTAASASLGNALPRNPVKEEDDDDEEMTMDVNEEGDTKTMIDYAKSSNNNNNNGKSMGTSTSNGVRSVSMRDMGTDMTPIASQDPSRTATPIRATTPSARSPVASRPSTPPRRCEHTLHKGEQGTRREIVALSCQLGKSSIAAAWASKEEEDLDASKYLNTSLSKKMTTSCSFESRAAAWEDAEQAKYMARYKREEVRIQAWESQQKRKAESEMQRIERRMEKTKQKAAEKLEDRVERIRRMAEERRANAEAKKGKHAVNTAHKADYIRQTGQMPSSSSFCKFLLFIPSCCKSSPLCCYSS